MAIHVWNFCIIKSVEIWGAKIYAQCKMRLGAQEVKINLIYMWEKECKINMLLLIRKGRCQNSYSRRYLLHVSHPLIYKPSLEKQKQFGCECVSYDNNFPFANQPLLLNVYIMYTFSYRMNIIKKSCVEVRRKFSHLYFHHIVPCRSIIIRKT